MKCKTNPSNRGEHTALHALGEGRVRTAGRLRRGGDRWQVCNAFRCVALDAHTPPDPGDEGALVQIEATWDGAALRDAVVEVVRRPKGDRPGLAGERSLSLAEAFELRQEATEKVRSFFEDRKFLEVDTPHRVEAPGTDIHLQPVCAHVEPLAPDKESPGGYLHTSPEFAMKRLLVEGCECIWQMAKVWRSGEITPLHNPEFTILEWYRAWEPVEAIIDDVEALTCELLDRSVQVPAGATPDDGDSPLVVDLEPPFERMTMREVVDRACGFDLLDALDFERLHDICAANDLLTASSLRRASSDERWDELFFELQVTRLEPYLASRGAVFVTEWPAPLAILARKKPSDPRVAERFELYVGGIELANGFQELTDPHEQRRRFQTDLSERAERGLPTLPLPERLLEALEWGLPPSSGVAVGFDRLLLLASAASDIREVMPFAMRRAPAAAQPRWA